MALSVAGQNLTAGCLALADQRQPLWTLSSGYCSRYALSIFTCSITFAALLHAADKKLSPLFNQSAWELLSTDLGARLTAVAVGVARLGEAPVSAMSGSAGAFHGTGRALSAAAGRLSYTYNLKVPMLTTLAWLFRTDAWVC